MSRSMMRAVVQDALGGPEVLRVAEVARPEPIPTEVLVRVHAAGINPVDWKTRQGGGMAGVLGEPPFTLGWDVSGVVEEVGFGVTTLAPGDEVYGMPWFPRQAGGYAEFVTAPARQFARKPATLGHEAAAAVPLAALTAWQILVDTAKVEAGSGFWCTPPPVASATSPSSSHGTWGRRSWGPPGRAATKGSAGSERRS